MMEPYGFQFDVRYLAALSSTRSTLAASPQLPTGGPFMVPPSYDPRTSLSMKHQFPDPRMTMASPGQPHYYWPPMPMMAMFNPEHRPIATISSSSSSNSSSSPGLMFNQHKNYSLAHRDASGQAVVVSSAPVPSTEGNKPFRTHTNSPFQKPVRKMQVDKTTLEAPQPAKATHQSFIVQPPANAFTRENITSEVLQHAWATAYSSTFVQPSVKVYRPEKVTSKTPQPTLTTHSSSTLEPTVDVSRPEKVTSKLPQPTLTPHSSSTLESTVDVSRPEKVTSETLQRTCATHSSSVVQPSVNVSRLKVTSKASQPTITTERSWTLQPPVKVFEVEREDCMIPLKKRCLRYPIEISSDEEPVLITPTVIKSSKEVASKECVVVLGEHGDRMQILPAKFQAMKQLGTTLVRVPDPHAAPSTGLHTGNKLKYYSWRHGDFIITDAELMETPMRQLNMKLMILPRECVEFLKSRRRSLKNRRHAQASRNRSSELRLKLEAKADILKHQLMSVQEELKQQKSFAASGSSQSTERLEYE